MRQARITDRRDGLGNRRAGKGFLRLARTGRLARGGNQILGIAAGTLDLGKLAIPAGLDPANAFGQWRMGGEHAVEGRLDPGAEIQVAELGSIRRPQLRAGCMTTDLLQRTTNAVGVAGELHRRGIGKKLALAADRGLDQVAENVPA